MTTDMQAAFEAAYAKACASSKPDDWMEAALLAKQLCNALASRPDAQADERGAFEAWVKSEYGYGTERYELSGYKRPELNMWWTTWQARAAAPQAEAAQGAPLDVEIRPIVMAGSPNACQVWLRHANGQQFAVGNPHETRADGEWFAGQLRKALAFPSPDREQVGEALGLSYQSCALLLNVLWHHQGGSSTVGQPIRTMLGIGQYDHLTEEQLSEAKRIEGMLAWHEAPDALPFRECGEKKPAGPADQAIYQAIADNYTRESAELGRPLSDFERVVLEYIAFNDGFINTRIRARQMLDGVGGERQGAVLSDDARECLQDVVSHYGNFVEALTCKRDTVTTKTDREYWQHELSANARMKRQAEHALAASAPTLGEPVPLRDIRMLAGYAEGSKSPRMVNAFRRVMRWLDDAPAVAQPQAAEPKGMTEAIEALQCPETHSCSNPELFERGWEIGRDAALDIVRALLAKGE